jgi:toxin FitB
MYLLDTNIISELRRQKPHGAVLAWLETVDDSDLFISAVTIGEIQAGIEITRKQDPEKAEALEAWLDQVANSFSLLAMDAKIFRAWAKLMHGRSDSVIQDAMIAATAEVHGLVVVTRNVRDFEGLGVRVFDPFGYAKK